MPRINIAPTRSNLLRLKQDLRFAREGYEILNRKREVLTSELMRVAHDAEIVQQEVDRLLTKAYHALDVSQMTAGQERVEWAALAANKTMEVQLKYRGIMGVAIPLIDARGAPPEIPYSLSDTNVALDETYAAFREALACIPEISRLTATVWRLAGELRKTQRRVNALQYVFIPDYEETIRFIEGSLEERDREDTFRLKLLKKQATHEDDTA
jgi:V/A-type H+-transporting ATPase subunit D